MHGCPSRLYGPCFLWELRNPVTPFPTWTALPSSKYYEVIRLPMGHRWSHHSGLTSLPETDRHAAPCSGLPRGLPSSRYFSAYIPRPMKTPAAPPESRPRPMPRQALQGTLRFLCFGFRCSEIVADRFIIIDEAALDFRECGLPCGLHASLCTLRMFCSANGQYGQYLRHTRNTRYGWWAIPYPMGTSTPQEASNFLALPDLLIRRKIG